MKHLIVLFLFLILCWERVFAAEAPTSLECEYAGAYEQCRAAHENNATRSMTDPLCSPNPDAESILDQIILDVRFREIDEQAKQYLVQLEADKDKYFWANAEEWVLRAIDDITKNFGVQWVYYKQYKELCDGGILAERATCTKKIPNPAAALRIKESQNATSCMNLVHFKLDVFTNVAYTQLKLNKSAVNTDAHQEYVQQERTKYGTLLSMMQTILGYIGRLSQWVTHWTPQPLQSAILKIIDQI